MAECLCAQSNTLVKLVRASGSTRVKSNVDHNHHYFIHYSKGNALKLYQSILLSIEQGLPLCPGWSNLGRSLASIPVIAFQMAIYLNRLYRQGR